MSSQKGRLAKELFLKGANCAQAVLGAFAPECGLKLEEALRLASGFGGGFARMREVCGTVSGMFLVMDLLYGYSDLTDKKIKDAHYRLLRRLADQFKKETSSIVCRELLSLEKGSEEDPHSSARTADYYRKRPCADLAFLAAEILERFLEAERCQNDLFFSVVRPPDVQEAAALWNSLKGTAYCLWDDEYPSLREAQSDVNEQIMYGFYEPDGTKLAAVGSVKHLDEHDSIAPFSGKNSCDLLRFGVRSEFQGRGVSKRFLAELYQVAAERGFDSMRILVGKDNLPALHLYLQSGAVQRGEHFSWNIHWLCLEKMLA